MLEFSKRPLRAIRRQLAIQKIKKQLRLQPAPTPFRIQVDQVLKELNAAGVNIVANQLDDQAVSQFAERAEYEFYYPNYYANRELHRLKKIREHYVAAKLLGLESSDIYLDVASQYAPAPQVYERLFGCQVLRQDFEYPSGRRGRVLGGSAAQIALDDESITKAAMHCSLEHFEGDEDIALINEMERILIPGGVFVVAPLYLSNEYFIFTQPTLYAELPASSHPRFDADATLYDVNSGNRHERYYDARHLLERIIRRTKLQITIHSFGSDTTCNLGQMRFVAVFKKTAP